MLADPEFQFLEYKVSSTRLNTAGARDQTPEVERQIKAIKERMRANIDNLPFPSFTLNMVIELVKHVVMLLNAFPPKSGLSITYIPRTIMTGKMLDWKNKCTLPFGDYSQMHEERNITNTLRE